MRIFVSSSFQDLQEHRLAAIRVLRQLGHEVVAMEDFVAASELPLQQMLDKVERCDLYVGVFAWRYGFVPRRSIATGVDPADPKVPLAVFGTTSITHYEFLHAKAKNIDRLAFLLDERVPWPPQLIDGFSVLDPTAPKDATAIRQLRSDLQRDAVVAYFSNPNDLEARVSAAVTVAGMSRQVRLNLAAVGQAMDSVEDSDPEQGIRTTMGAADQKRALKIDLEATWWSTRLYLTAALAERLTRVRRIVVTRGDEFVGLLSTAWILSTLASRHPKLAAFGKRLAQRRTVLPDAGTEMTAVFALWTAAFGGADARQQEEATKLVLTEGLLRTWFGDAMLQQAIHVPDLAQATVVDLLRILDYPSAFVPVVSRRPAPAAVGVAVTETLRDPIQVVDKSALNAQLSQSYVTELMDRARIA